MAFYGRESVSCSTFIFGNLQLMNSYKGNTEYAGVTVNEIHSDARKQQVSDEIQIRLGNWIVKSFLRSALQEEAFIRFRFSSGFH